jgi:hypothetical protein
MLGILFAISTIDGLCCLLTINFGTGNYIFLVFDLIHRDSEKAFSVLTY